ncbi:MAG: hypothetical protein HGA78_10575 [Nitrospirales bacterium]|nr:hypothetical protein [Nitrospirales bacterium]
MQQTLKKVKTLEKFVQKHGEDAFISNAITKMLDYKVQRYDEQIKRLNRDLKRFERVYKKDSSAFFREFQEGSLGDSMDFVEWSSLYQMRNRLLEEKAEIEGAA